MKFKYWGDRISIFGIVNIPEHEGYEVSKVWVLLSEDGTLRIDEVNQYVDSEWGCPINPNSEINLIKGELIISVQYRNMSE